jgi:hypothetical protein
MQIPEMSWHQYRQLAAIAPLPLHEQVRRYNIYINEILEARTAYLYQEMVNAQSLGSGAAPVSEEQSELPSNCIQFVNNTSDGTQCRLWIETSSPTDYTITWGDGETTTGTTTPGEFEGVGIGNGDNKLQIDYTYANSDTEYTARICFDNITSVTYLEFNGDE